MRKLIPILSALYVICPIDFIPDVIPVFGWVDDVVAIIIGVKALMKKHSTP
ncbi:YkvA family protein [Zavarzinella formosa]|uniref:YkvA family protein n=1 Tax=Zavarzinella formosa TaxID=360055 RepID=UPI0002EA34C2|nr:DUF1232 domain-containing protein [Zavarzinella formosa]